MAYSMFGKTLPAQTLEPVVRSKLTEVAKGFNEQPYTTADGGCLWSASHALRHGRWSDYNVSQQLTAQEEREKLLAIPERAARGPGTRVFLREPGTNYTRLVSRPSNNTKEVVDQVLEKYRAEQARIRAELDRMARMARIMEATKPVKTQPEPLVIHRRLVWR